MSDKLPYSEKTRSYTAEGNGDGGGGLIFGFKKNIPFKRAY